MSSKVNSRSKTNTSSLSKNKRYAFILALIGGIFASLSGVFGKIVVDSKFLSTFISQDKIDYALRAISIGGISLCTTMQWRYSAKSMDLSSSLSSTVITTASNFFFTAFFGWLFFHDSLSAQWWVGATLIMIGLYFMNADANENEVIQKKNK
ncbi:hypothetical protein PPL_01844 [Heterostelium album PN500]|uniref:Transmembrane protein 42 n=1 Tax=Heterostelium pallidum (strain ATCC 26659 / Pp 5 / PN500) TaxID=670386 RepID=D3B0M7_HETP5|nr:hypothetical protein PPL_01844 [Heterostelium album PN500]EFA84851.1 hypothetical protein PPL_01844 [Heterostelium album PN500]|eukprot:XP_020436962.1 hypothetical protein PPL_01844 [Heterostelium album PN500]